MNKEELMRTLHLTSEEADELIAYDLDVDKGKPSPYDLDEEHMKVAKEAMNMTTHRSSAKARDGTRTAQKVSIISLLADFLDQNDTILVENVSILNPEKTISFNLDDNLYEISLLPKRIKAKSF